MAQVGRVAAVLAATTGVTLFAPTSDRAGAASTSLAFTLTGTQSIALGCAGGAVTRNGAPVAPAVACVDVNSIRVDGSFRRNEIDLGAVAPANFTTLTSILLRGGDGDDLINGSAFGERIYGDFGNDTINAAGGDDRVFGGRGRDLIRGNDGQDQIYGCGDHADIPDEGNFIAGGRGQDSLNGCAGDDRIEGNEDSDYADGGDGHDVINGGLAGDYLHGGPGSDTVSGNEGDDVLTDGASAVTDDDTLNGGTGRDAILSMGGADTLIGGEGFDTFDHDASDAPSTADHVTIDGGEGFDAVVVRTWLAQPNSITQTSVGFDGAVVEQASGPRTDASGIERLELQGAGGDHDFAVEMSPGIPIFVEDQAMGDFDRLDVTAPAGFTQRGAIIEAPGVRPVRFHGFAVVTVHE